MDHFSKAPKGYIVNLALSQRPAARRGPSRAPRARTGTAQALALCGALTPADLFPIVHWSHRPYRPPLRPDDRARPPGKMRPVPLPRRATARPAARRGPSREPRPVVRRRDSAAGGWAARSAMDAGRAFFPAGRPAAQRDDQARATGAGRRRRATEDSRARRPQGFLNAGIMGAWQPQPHRVAKILFAGGGGSNISPSGPSFLLLPDRGGLGQLADQHLSIQPRALTRFIQQPSLGPLIRVPILVPNAC